MRHLLVVFLMTIVFFGGGLVTGFASTTEIVSPQTETNIIFIGLWEDGTVFNQKVVLPENGTTIEFVTVILSDKEGNILKKENLKVPKKGNEIFIGSIGKSNDVYFMSVLINGQVTSGNLTLTLSK